MISLPEFSSNTNPKWPLIVAFSNSSGVVQKEDNWCTFQSNTSVCELIRGNVKGPKNSDVTEISIQFSFVVVLHAAGKII